MMTLSYRIKKFAGKPNYNLSKRAAKPKYIAVHYTGGTGSAKNNVIYFRGGNRSASADFFIDDSSIWRFNPDVAEYYSWHIGDGHGKYGYTNANTIGIEVVSSGKEFTKAEKKRLRFLVRKMQKKYGIPAKNVIRHYDASRKLCPAAYCGTTKKNAAWKELHKYITR